MDTLFAILILGLFAAGVAAKLKQFYDVFKPVRRVEDGFFEKAGEKLKLECFPVRLAGRAMLRGRMKGLSVEVVGEVGAEGMRRVSIEVSGKSLPRRETALLDELNKVGGLGWRDRKRIEARERCVRWESSAPPVSAAELQEWVETVVDAAERLSRHSPARILADRVREDPDDDARVRILSVLAAHQPDGPETRAALASALADKSSRVRLEAALRAPGDLGRPVLQELVSKSQEPEALRPLVERLPADQGSQVLGQTMGGSEGMKSAAIHLALELGRTELLAPVRALAAAGGLKGRLALEIASYLARQGSVEDEAVLLPALRSDADEVRLAVIAGLSRWGTARAVEPLLQLRGKAVEEAAREAVRAIQSRLGDADAGRLSVVEAIATEGAVSIRALVQGEKDGEGR